MSKQKHLEGLVNKCLKVVDRLGVVKSKSSSPVSSSLSMELERNGLHIFLKAYAAAQGNGSCQVNVIYRKKTVFDASGKFMATPYDVEAEVYVTGAWEKRINQLYANLQR